MIDTFEFDLYPWEYNVPDKNVFSPSLDILDSRNPQLVGARLHPEIKLVDNANTYYPKVSAYCFTRTSGQRHTNIKIKCSVPKFMKGENLFSIREDSAHAFCTKMAGVLDIMGVKVRPETIANAKVCEVHLAHNIILPVPVYMVVGDVGKALVPTDMDINRASFKNGGLEVQYYYKSWEFAFYDKTMDVQNLIGKAKKPIGMENFSQEEIYKTCAGKHIFRMELRLKDTTHMKTYLAKVADSIGKKHNFKSKVCVADIFNNNLVENALLMKWKEVEKNIFILPAYKRSTQNYIAEVKRKHPELGMEIMLKRVYIAMMLAEKGVRSARKFLLAMGNKKGKVETLIKDAMKLKVSKHMPNYIRHITTELKKFIPLTKELLTEDVKQSKLLLNMDKFEFLTIEEVAKMLKLSEMTIYRYIDDGKLSAYKISGKAYRITPEDLKAFLKSKKVGKR